MFSVHCSPHSKRKQTTIWNYWFFWLLCDNVFRARVIRSHSHRWDPFIHCMHLMRKFTARKGSLFVFNQWNYYFPFGFRLSFRGSGTLIEKLGQRRSSATSNLVNCALAGQTSLCSYCFGSWNEKVLWNEQLTLFDKFILMFGTSLRRYINILIRWLGKG